jgi:CheY-like chemotaxis protein
MSVLVVDDEKDALSLAEAILTTAGATVMTASSAADALEMLQRSPPDVLISDVEMPDEDGYSLIRKVRAWSRSGGTGIGAIALTAYGRPQDRERCLAAGFNMHVSKPVDPGALTAVIAGVAADEAVRRSVFLPGRSD